jgi:hypothetical protein
MLRWSPRLCLCLLALSLAAVPVAGEVFHVRLHNGSVIDTAYQPVQCTWDPGMVLVMTEVGNWIGLQQKEIDSVESETQVRGFGVAINTSTISIGWAPNDAVDPASQQQNAPSAADLAIVKMAQDEAARQHYTVQQGVSSEQTQGIPSGLTGYSGGGGYGGASTLPIYRPPAAPAPAPMQAPAPVAATPPPPGL